MNKRNVTLIEDAKPVGWLIYRPQAQDFLYSYGFAPGHSVQSFVEEPVNAYSFISESVAFNFAKFIEYQTQIVPMFDMGHEIAVVFTPDVATYPLSC